MGTWGHNSFENDDALDWVSNDFEGSEDLSAAASALQTVADWGADEYLEFPEAGAALAAAEVLAAILGRPSPALPADIAAWVVDHPSDDAASLISVALKAVERVERDSEMQGCWDDAGDSSKWRAVVADLKARLRG